MKTLIVLAAAVFILFPACVQAAPAKPSMEVVVLGSGGPRPFGRGGSSFIVVLEGQPRILVDAGPGAFLRIGELGLDLDKVDTVLLTHLHIDHAGDPVSYTHLDVYKRQISNSNRRSCAARCSRRAIREIHSSHVPSYSFHFLDRSKLSHPKFTNSLLARPSWRYPDRSQSPKTGSTLESANQHEEVQSESLCCRLSHAAIR